MTSDLSQKPVSPLDARELRMQLIRVTDRTPVPPEELRAAFDALDAVPVSGTIGDYLATAIRAFTSRVNKTIDEREVRTAVLEIMNRAQQDAREPGADDESSD